ncbi:MAG: outer membrane protein OmpA-like peptidoglycan-associated protein [Enterobacterales bacterium]|jgi:outer membrane protein OmpA-like peptidoglycan-associated protein
MGRKCSFVLSFILSLAVIDAVTDAGVVQADLRDYEAPLDSAKWALEGSAIKCSLTQEIPLYGMASFTSLASRKSNMNFDLALRRYNANRVTEAVLSSEPPLWKHNSPSKPMGAVTMFPGDTPVNIKNRKAWNLLVQLEQGMFPTFAYESWLKDDDQVSVALSAVNFQPVYDEFLNCVSSLLPYSFDDISETYIYFDFDRSDFNRQSREALSKIGAWLEVDKSLELVLLAGHTDNKGKRRYNYKLGKKRAEAVKTFFTDAGIAARQIKVQTFADIQPQSSNETPEGRSMNRRVLIKMVK